MSYEETLEYLYSQLPMFTRIGSVAFKKDLHNTIALCEALNNPHKKFQSLHIAGTNGKGSTSHLLASVLMEAGYKTGLYTSPHLLDFRERIRVNGEMIPKEEVVAFVRDRKETIEKISPSFFEMTVALCFDHFAKSRVDIAVIETGLGGRLDSTNVITPLLSIITNIGFDHMDMLGHTLEAIAGEKAGIIKKHVPAIIVRKNPETDPVFVTKAKSLEAAIEFATDHYEIASRENRNGISYFTIYDKNKNSSVDLECPLSGDYQNENFTGVYAAVQTLIGQGFKISDDDIKKGFANVIRNTGLRGRWEILQQQPKVICDTGHNEDGIRFIVNQLKKEKFNTLRIVLGMVKDKDISKILQMLPRDAVYYFCNADLPRALEAELLREQAVTAGLSGSSYSSVRSARDKALEDAGANDLVFIGGSTFVVAEALA